MLSTELADLKAYMAQNPGTVIEDVARERKVTLRAVIEALPPQMVRIGRGDAFAQAMRDIAHWGEVTLIVHTDDAIFEFTGAIPAGEVGRGYFNLMQPKGLHGHLRHERCAAIAFVERPFMGKSSGSANPFAAAPKPKLFRATVTQHLASFQLINVLRAYRESCDGGPYRPQSWNLRA